MIDKVHAQEWRIESLTAAGPIRFGMTPQQVRALVREAPVPFRKGPSSPVPTDAFDDLAVHVHYDAGGRCAAVEFFPGGVDPTFEGHHLLATPYRKLEALLIARDRGTRTQVDGLLSLACGVGLVAVRKRNNAPPGSAIAFRSGYYDDAADALQTLAQPRRGARRYART